MAELIIKRSSRDWNVGDHIEAFGERKLELVEQGIADIVKDDGMKENLNVVTRTEEQIKADKRAYYESHFGKKKIEEVK